MLLLLLLLLTGIGHSPLRQCNGVTEDVDVADMIGEDQHQCRVEIGALLIAQSAMRLDDGAKGVIRLGKI